MIRLEDIRKTYEVGPTKLEVLRGISIKIDSGEFVSIMGQSGSGKSTLMNIIGLLDTPTTGRYVIDDLDVGKAKPHERSRIRNRNIGFVFQSFHLLPRLNSRSNVALPLIYRQVSSRRRNVEADRWLERVGMADRARHKPNELSGGQRQRIAIARALVGKPRLLLADEPTGALDENTSADIMQLLIELNEYDGVTMMIITHDPDVAAKCKRRLRLVAGELSEYSRPNWVATS